MLLNLHQLELVYTVARLGSISRAANELRISQPSISSQVREFELRCGFDLFHRLPRGMVLTEAGQKVFEHAKRIFGETGELQTTLQNMRVTEHGALTVGGSLTAGEFFLPSICKAFSARHPGIGLSICLDNSSNTLRKIGQGELDFAFVGTDSIGDDLLTALPCWTDELVVIASPTAVGSQSSPLTVRELHDRPFVMREQGSATQQHVEQRLREHDVTVRTVLAVSSPEAVKRHVNAGLGWGFASRASVIAESNSGQLAIVDLADWRCSRTFSAVYRKGYRLTPPQREFITAAQALSAERGLV